jgi:hypothetical protein
VSNSCGFRKESEPDFQLSHQILFDEADFDLEQFDKQSKLIQLNYLGTRSQQFDLKHAYGRLEMQVEFMSSQKAL